MRPLFVCKFIRVLPFVVWGLTVACGSDDPSAASTHCTGASCSPGEGKDAGIETDDGGSWAKPDAASCTPSGADVPDDDFADQNCDGIDGDLEKAIFVAPSGSDAAQGTRESPVKTLNKATALAAASGKDVYACNGSYAEALVVSSAVRLYGGYDCKNGWARNKELAVIAPASGKALTIEKVTGVVVDRFELRAPDGDAAGQSSIAAVVRASQGVRFNRVVFDAGEGASGLAGENAVAVTAPAPAGTEGTAISVTKCSTTATGECLGAPKGGKNYAEHSCGAATTRGGFGGHGGNVKGNTSTGDGQAGLNSALGGKFPFAGSPGAPGAVGAHGKAGDAIGTVVSGEYVASNSGSSGVLGTLGLAGGGGAGGKSSWGCGSFCHDVGSGGGQGGYGGCGGGAGGGGAGGGASIALLVIDSDVTLAWSTLRTAGGGSGGAPGAGAAGQPGGAAGKAGTHVNTIFQGQPGGAGGPGGEGGAGGPGGGGPSIGVLVAGSAPKTEAVTFDLGPGGAGGKAMAGASGATGKSGDVVQVGP